jgi:hypothetical protein
MAPANSASVSGCCAAIVRQQQETSVQQRQCQESAISPHPAPKKFCTVVEKGLVVVRPIPDRLE